MRNLAVTGHSRSPTGAFKADAPLSEDACRKRSIARRRRISTSASISSMHPALTFREAHPSKACRSTMARLSEAEMSRSLPNMKATTVARPDGTPSASKLRGNLPSLAAIAGHPALTSVIDRRRPASAMPRDFPSPRSCNSPKLEDSTSIRLRTWLSPKVAVFIPRWQISAVFPADDSAPHGRIRLETRGHAEGTERADSINDTRADQSRRRIIIAAQAVASEPAKADARQRGSEAKPNLAGQLRKADLPKLVTIKFTPAPDDAVAKWQQQFRTR